MDQILIGSVPDGLVHGCLCGLLCPSCVMSVTNYIRAGLFFRDGLWFLVLHSLTDSLTH